METLTTIIIAVISGGVASSVISFFYDRHKYKLEVLLAAFQDEKNDKASRIDAWKQYKKSGGHNYTNYLTKLNELND